MKRFPWAPAMIVFVASTLAGCMRILDFETERPMVVMNPTVAAPIGLAPVKGAPAKPAHTELASFAAG